MREFVKVASVLVVSAAILTIAIAWADDRPNQLTWILRFAPVFVVLAALAVFLRLHFQRDLVPDYLYATCGKYFDRDGFCFATALENMDGVCVLHTYFQNRYDRPCVGKIALRPAKEFFVRPDMDTIAIYAQCDGGAFGVHRIAVGIPRQMQGRKVKLEVGASVTYPDGRGKMLRFREGHVLRADTDFHNSFARSMTIAGALSGAIVLTKPAATKLQIPPNVSEQIPDDIEPHTAILWRPGDEPI
jgi:hypothetical protein